MSDELKACPFCGEKAVYTNAEGWPAYGNYQTYWCSCGNVHCMTENQCVSVDTWQSRPLEEALRTDLAAARARIAELEAEREKLWAHLKEYWIRKPTDNWQWGYRSALIGILDILEPDPIVSANIVEPELEPK